MKHERARWRVAAGAMLGFAVVLAVLAVNPPNFPEAWLERWLTAKLPPGSSIVAVRDAIEEEHWPTMEEWISRDGSMVLVLLGRSWFNRRYAYVYFGFDRFGRLTSIDVQKHDARLEPRGTISGRD